MKERKKKTSIEKDKKERNIKLGTKERKFGVQISMRVFWI